MEQEVFIPTYFSINENTKYHKIDKDYVRFTLWLRENDEDFGVINFCYTTQDLKCVDSKVIENCILYYLADNNVNVYKGNKIIRPSDFNKDNCLFIKDLYYPKQMELPFYCGI